MVVETTPSKEPEDSLAKETRSQAKRDAVGGDLGTFYKGPTRETRVVMGEKTGIQQTESVVDALKNTRRRGMKLRRTLRKFDEYTVWDIAVKTINGIVLDGSKGQETGEVKNLSCMTGMTADMKSEICSGDKRPTETGKRKIMEEQMMDSHNKKLKYDGILAGFIGQIKRNDPRKKLGEARNTTSSHDKRGTRTFHHQSTPKSDYLTRA